MVECRNAERTANSLGHVSIEWASPVGGLLRITDSRNRPHRFLKTDGPQFDNVRWFVVPDLDT
jgi:hypothetical protein